MLTSTGQELKWYALAPLLATLATFLLIDLGAHDRVRWAAYVLSLLLLVETHYFCIWIVPAHALFAWWCRPELRRRFAVAYGAWMQPATPKPIAASHLYTRLAMIGGEPSPVRARYRIPVAGGVLWLLWRGWFAADPRRRDFVRAGAGTFAVALVAQTVYALHLGQTVPMTATSIAPWCPLVMIATMLGALELKSARWRTAAALSAPQDVPSAIVFRSDRDAKMVNVFYDGPALQMIWTGDGARDVPRRGGPARRRFSGRLRAGAAAPAVEPPGAAPVAGSHPNRRPPPAERVAHPRQRRLRVDRALAALAVEQERFVAELVQVRQQVAGGVPAGAEVLVGQLDEQQGGEPPQGLVASL
jgi:hypothetical protein